MTNRHASSTAIGRDNHLGDADLPPDSPGWAHRWAVVNGVRLHYVEAGAGPLVVLLHGFPEFWYAWRRQIIALAAAGFTINAGAEAPDLRGYNLLSDKPGGVDAYRVEALTADVAERDLAAGERTPAVVSHDWGGVLAWFAPLLPGTGAKARHSQRSAPPQRCARCSHGLESTATLVVRVFLPDSGAAGRGDPAPGDFYLLALCMLRASAGSRRSVQSGRRDLLIRRGSGSARG